MALMVSETKMLALEARKASSWYHLSLARSQSGRLLRPDLVHSRSYLSKMSHYSGENKKQVSIAQIAVSNCNFTSIYSYSCRLTLLFIYFTMLMLHKALSLCCLSPKNTAQNPRPLLKDALVYPRSVKRRVDVNISTHSSMPIIVTLVRNS